MNNRGSLLIFVLWVLAFLSVVAVQLGVGVRQKIILVKRLEQRAQLQRVTEAGIKKTIAVLLDDLQANEFAYTAAAKVRRHNNLTLENISLPDGWAVVDYASAGSDGKSGQKFGAVDEERKLNLNTVEPWMLRRLIAHVLSWDEDKAKKLADAILDWRQMGEHELTGFFSDDYYSNLEFPYPEKKGPYELLEELLMVKGMTQDIFDRLAPYVTVYGDGKVNVNTAPREVLVAMGLSDPVADKLLAVRRGADGADDTADDFVFNKTFDIASDVAALVKLEPAEFKEIDNLNQRGWVTVASYYFTIQSRGRLEGASQQKTIRCVFNSQENRIISWYEKL